MAEIIGDNENLRYIKSWELYHTPVCLTHTLTLFQKNLSQKQCALTKAAASSTYCDCVYFHNIDPPTDETYSEVP